LFVIKAIKKLVFDRASHFEIHCSTLIILTIPSFSKQTFKNAENHLELLQICLSNIAKSPLKDLFAMVVGVKNAFLDHSRFK